MLIRYVLVFIAGFAEFVIRVVDYKAIQRSMCIYSSVITFINIWVWYYIIDSIVKNLGDIWLIFIYALGCAIGNYITLKIDLQTHPAEKIKKRR